MKKRKKLLLGLSTTLLCSLSLIGCGNSTNSNTPSDNPPADPGETVTGVSYLVISGTYKTEYVVGEDLDFTGMVITAYFEDGTNRVVSLSDCKVYGNTSKAGTKTVSITYGDAEEVVIIKVTEKGDDPVDPGDDPVDPGDDPVDPGDDPDPEVDPTVGDGSVERPYSPSQAYDLAMTLSAGAQTPICYFIKGTVANVNDSGTTQYGNINFNLTESGSTKKFYCFQVYYLNKQMFTQTGTIKDGDTVTIFSAIVNYQGNTPETTNKGTAYVYQHNDKKSSSVPEQGFPEPSANAKAVTISQLISENSSWKTEGANSNQLYRITGVAQYAVNNNYGNLDIIDSSSSIYVHGLTRNKKGLVNDGENGKVIDNDKSFSSIGLNPGDEVTIEGWYAYHKYDSGYGIPQFTGYVTGLKKSSSSYIPSNISYTASEDSNSYYNNVDSLSGNDLLKGLHNLMDSTHTRYTSYKSLDGYFDDSDPYSGGGVKCFYSGEKATKYNKEHVWPQSLSNKLYGEDGGGSDLHHIRPTISTYNSARGSSMFGNIYACGSNKGKSFNYTSGGKTYYTSNVFEPADNIKGDVARIIMYMYVHYNDGSLDGYSTEEGTDWNQSDYYGQLHINWVMGPATVKECFKLLRYWNSMDPVDMGEKTRNNEAASIQGNRNPFIAHPSYADKIWG